MIFVLTSRNVNALKSWGKNVRHLVINMSTFLISGSWCQYFYNLLVWMTSCIEGIEVSNGFFCSVGVLTILYWPQGFGVNLSNGSCRNSQPKRVNRHNHRCQIDAFSLAKDPHFFISCWCHTVPKLLWISTQKPSVSRIGHMHCNGIYLHSGHCICSNRDRLGFYAENLFFLA